MLVKTIIDEENRRKWEIYKHEKTAFPYPVYTVSYYEYYMACGWRLICDGAKDKEYYTKKCIEWDFEIKIA